MSNRLLVEGKDFVLLPEAIWKVFVSWYCSSAYNSIPALPRTVGFTLGETELRRGPMAGGERGLG